VGQNVTSYVDTTGFSPGTSLTYEVRPLAADPRCLPLNCTDQTLIIPFPTPTPTPAPNSKLIIGRVWWDKDEDFRRADTTEPLLTTAAPLATMSFRYDCGATGTANYNVINLCDSEGLGPYRSDFIPVDLIPPEVGGICSVTAEITGAAANRWYFVPKPGVGLGGYAPWTDRCTFTSNASGNFFAGVCLNQTAGRCVKLKVSFPASLFYPNDEYHRAFRLWFAINQVPLTCTSALLSPANVGSLTVGQSQVFKVTAVDAPGGLSDVAKVEFASDDAGIVGVTSPDTTPEDDFFTTATALAATEVPQTIAADIFLTGNSSSTPDCSGRATIEKIIAGSAWWQTQGADLRSAGNLTSLIPGLATEPYLSLNSAGDGPGVAFYLGAANFAAGQVSTTGWLAQTGLTDFWQGYQYFYSLLTGRLQNLTPGSFSVSSLPSGFYLVNGDLEIGNSWKVKNGEKIVILVQGQINIKHKVEVESGGFLLLAAKGDITLDSNLKDEGGKAVVQGVLVTDGSLRTGASNEEITLEGMVAAKQVELQRTLDEKELETPREKFVYRPDLWFNLPRELSSGERSWQELVP
jgi:hypothetical protein